MTYPRFNKAVIFFIYSVLQKDYIEQNKENTFN